MQPLKELGERNNRQFRYFLRRLRGGAAARALAVALGTDCVGRDGERLFHVTSRRRVGVGGGTTRVRPDRTRARLRDKLDPERPPDCHPRMTRSRIRGSRQAYLDAARDRPLASAPSPASRRLFRRGWTAARDVFIWVEIVIVGVPVAPPRVVLYGALWAPMDNSAD